MANIILTCIILFIPFCWVIVGSILAFIWIKKRLIQACTAILNRVNTSGQGS